MAAKKKIVMIDDEIDLCLLVKANLEETGEFDVMAVSDSQEAVGICLREIPDLILLDIVMPKVKGTEIIKALKGFAETKKIPVIVISGLGEIVYYKKKEKWQWLPNRPVVLNRGEVIHERDPDKAAEAYDVESYITKPFTTEGLLEVIRDVLRRKMSENEGAEIS